MTCTVWYIVSAQCVCAQYVCACARVHVCLEVRLAHLCGSKCCHACLCALGCLHAVHDGILAHAIA